MKLIRNNNLSKDLLQVDESIFSVSNGYIGIRGSFCEGYGDSQTSKGSYINGVYEERNYNYEENLPGFPQVGQTIVDVVSGQSIIFLVNDEIINLKNCELRKLDRFFDIAKGYSSRKAYYKTKNGFEFVITENRVASFVQNELFMISMTIESINYDGEVLIKSLLEIPVGDNIQSNDPRLGKQDVSALNKTESKTFKNYGFIGTVTNKSNISIRTSFTHDVDFDYLLEDDLVIAEKTISLSIGSIFEFTKFLVYTSNNKHKNYVLENDNLISEVVNKGYSYYLNQQEQYLNEFWKTSLIEIKGNDYLQTLINYNIYQLNSSGTNDSRFNIPAKGLSGEGYEGHHFWDTEIYMIPFFSLTNPEKAKTLLMNRFINLDKSRLEAKALGHNKGAKIPWRTITGEEVSPYYPAGTAQYHINSDVAYAFIKYYEVTNDIDFMIDYGFEVIIETARVLLDLGNYSNNLFHINAVTGPDEYTTCINDNYFTNSMAKYHFEYIVTFYNKHKEILSSVLKRLNVTDVEILDFNEAASKMTLLFNEELNIYVQDASFLNKEKWDLNSIPKSKFPLLLNFHPLKIYRSQVIKQADVLLSMFLLDCDNLDILEDSFNYYSEITTHDSSLSKCVHGILATKLNKVDLSYKYLIDVCEIDVLDAHKNTKDGLHVANMGGSYMSIIYGLAGLRITSEYLKISPLIPKELQAYKFKVIYQAALVEVKVTKTKVYLISNKKVKIRINEEVIDLIGEYSTDLLNQ